MRGYIEKNPSLTLARDKAKIEYISKGQPSPRELTFGVKLGLNPHSKIIKSKCIHQGKSGFFPIP